MVIPTVNVRKRMMRVNNRSRFYAIALETQVLPQLMLRVENFRVVVTDTVCRAANGQAGRTRSLGALVGEVAPVQRVPEVLLGSDGSGRTECRKVAPVQRLLIFVCLLAAAAPSDPTIASKGQQVGMRWRLDVKEIVAQLRVI